MSQDIFNRAVAALQAGNPAQAEQLCVALLKADGGNFSVLHLLGVARFQLGRLPEAIAAMEAALAVEAGSAPAWSNLGMMQAAAERPAEALASFERALSLGPPQPQLLANAGNALLSLGRAEEALTRFDLALSLNPGLVEALIGRANVYREMGRPEQSLADCDRALSLVSAHPQALNNRALALSALGRYAEALESADRSLAARPNAPGQLSNRAGALLGLKRFAEALESCDRALALAPRHAEALCNRGAALQGLQRGDEALAAFDAALAVNPALAQAHANRAAPLHQLQRDAEAFAACERALALAPPTAEVFCNRGIALCELGRHAEALASFTNAIALDAGHAQSQFNKAQLLLQLGRFEEGLPLYEWRRALNPMDAAPAAFQEHAALYQQITATRDFAQSMWRGEDISGKTLFAHWEQGLGDTLMFARYAGLLNAMGARVVLSVPAKMAALFRGLVPQADILAGDAVPDTFDFHIPMASLMLALKTRIDTIPAPVPYMRADPGNAQAWRARIGAGGFKIGIAWQGSRGLADIGRSFPVARLAPVAGLAGVRLISLQKGEGTEQLETLAPGMAVETLGADFDAGPDGFVDAAAAMAAMDLVITSDTSIAHLAGAMGLRVWVALRHNPEWRWLLGRRDSPWYPSATLFRQPSQGDWEAVFEAMAAELKRDPALKPSSN